MAAATSLFHSLPLGAHVVAPRVMYWALRRWLAMADTSGRLHVDFVDATALDELRRAVEPGRTRLLWIETPANPLWSITDIAGAAAIAHRAGALLAVDSTAATPVLTRPLALGADIVMHSATKYLNGHDRVIAGAAGVRLWKRATSLGGVESLIEHRASVEGADSPAPPDLLRLSVGIEDSSDLIADLDSALGG